MALSARCRALEAAAEAGDPDLERLVAAAAAAFAEARPLLEARVAAVGG